MQTIRAAVALPATYRGTPRVHAVDAAALVALHHAEPAAGRPAQREPGRTTGAALTGLRNPIHQTRSNGAVDLEVPSIGPSKSASAGIETAPNNRIVWSLVDAATGKPC